MKTASILCTLLMAFVLLACESDDNAPSSEICDVLAEISESRFNATDNTNYLIEEARIVGDCLEVQLQSGGCDGSTWSARLFDSGSIDDSLPPQRAIIIALKNNEECDALVSRSFSFELTPLQLANEESVLLLLTGWTPALEYDF